MASAARKKKAAVQRTAQAQVKMSCGRSAAAHEHRRQRVFHFEPGRAGEQEGDQYENGTGGKPAQRRRRQSMKVQMHTFP
ncbi:MAG: hypothetical protein KGQ77_01540 [Betaproteobacteria bacterium]|nr:hypothetical protein [Betaproteobacteria bacterium]